MGLKVNPAWESEEVGEALAHHLVQRVDGPSEECLVDVFDAAVRTKGHVPTRRVLDHVVVGGTGAAH